MNMKFLLENVVKQIKRNDIPRDISDQKRDAVWLVFVDVKLI